MSQDDVDDARRLEQLLEVMREHDLDALTMRVGDVKYELTRRDPAAPPVAAAAGRRAGRPPSPSGPPPAPVSGANVKKVTAPVVGVFYGAPAPGAEPFVSVGDRVSVGQVICILEAMKMMNEITTDYAGVVTRIIPQNGELVALGEDLLWIEP